MQGNNFYPNTYIPQTNLVQSNDYNVNSLGTINDLQNVNSHNLKNVRINKFVNNAANPMHYLNVSNAGTNIPMNNTHPYYQSTAYNNQLRSGGNSVALQQARNDIYQEIYNNQATLDTISSSTQSNTNSNFSLDLCNKNMEYIRNRIQSKSIQKHYNNNFIAQNTDFNKNYYVPNINNEANKVLLNKNHNETIMKNAGTVPNVIEYSTEPSYLISHIPTYDNSSSDNTKQVAQKKSARRKPVATKNFALNENNSVESNSSMNSTHQDNSYYNAVSQNYINIFPNNEKQKQISNSEVNEIQSKNKMKKKPSSMSDNTNHDVIFNAPNSNPRAKRMSLDQKKMRLDIEKNFEMSKRGNVDFNKNIPIAMGEDIARIQLHADANGLYSMATVSNKNDDMLRGLLSTNEPQFANNRRISTGSSIVTNSFEHHNTINVDATSNRSTGVVVPDVIHKYVERNGPLTQNPCENVSSSKSSKNTNAYDLAIQQSKHDNPVTNVVTSCPEKVDISNTNSVKQMDYRVLGSISDLSNKEANAGFKTMMSYYIKPFRKGRCLKFNPKTNENSFRNRKKGCADGVQSNSIIDNLHYKGPYYLINIIGQMSVHGNKANESNCNNKKSYSTESTNLLKLAAYKKENGSYFKTSPNESTNAMKLEAYKKVYGNNIKTYPNEVSSSQQVSCMNQPTNNIVSAISSLKITDIDNKACENLKHIKSFSDVLKVKSNVCMLDGNKDDNEKRDIMSIDVSKPQGITRSEDNNLDSNMPLLNIPKSVTKESAEKIPVIVKNTNNTDIIKNDLENNKKLQQEIHISSVVKQSLNTYSEVIEIDDECDSSETIKPSGNISTVVTNKNNLKPDFNQMQNEVNTQVENKDMPYLMDYLTENCPITVNKPENIDLTNQLNDLTSQLNDQPPLETVLHVTTSSTGMVSINVELKKENKQSDILDIAHVTNKNVEKKYDLINGSIVNKENYSTLCDSSRETKSHYKLSKNKTHLPVNQVEHSRKKYYIKKTKSYNKAKELELSGECYSKNYIENKEKTKKVIDISLKKECRVGIPANEKALADAKYYKCHICKALFLSKEMYEKDAKIHNDLYEILFGPDHMTDSSTDAEISKSMSNIQEEKKVYNSLSKIPVRVSPIRIKIKKPKSIFKKMTISGVDSNKSKIKKMRTLPTLISLKECNLFKDPFNCKSCKTRFSSKLLLDLHLKKSCKIISSEGLFNSCQGCGTEFNNNQSLNLHACSKDNIDVRNYQCKLCSKRFIDISLFDLHVKNHYSRMGYY